MIYNEYEIINNIIYQTKKGLLLWSYNSSDFNYLTNFKITGNKNIKIEFYYDLKYNNHSIIFIFNNNDKVIEEIKEIYLFNIISDIKYLILKYKFKKLYKSIE